VNDGPDPCAEPARVHLCRPLKRTGQTADIALGGRDYQTDDRLKEIFAGRWEEGHLRADIFKTLHEASPRKVRILEFYCRAPDGERL